MSFSVVGGIRHLSVSRTPERWESTFMGLGIRIWFA